MKASSRRPAPPLTSDYTSAFLKDWARLKASGRYDLGRLTQAILLLIAREQLGPEWHDHPLKGEWAGHRECHVGGDFLLIYTADDRQITFVRAGTHADLFEG